MTIILTSSVDPSLQSLRGVHWKINKTCHIKIARVDGALIRKRIVVLLFLLQRFLLQQLEYSLLISIANQ